MRKGSAWAGWADPFLLPGNNEGDIAITNHRAGVWEHFTFGDGLPDMKIECLAEDSRGRLWIGTHEQGVVGYEGGELRCYSCLAGLSVEGVFSIVEHGQGNLWFGTNRGLTVYDGRECIHLATGEPCIFQWGSCQDYYGRLWFCMERQPGLLAMVARWDGRHRERLVVGGEMEAQGQSILRLACDGAGIVW